MANLFTATGEEAKKSASKKNVDLKTAYIRLKENESVRVRVLGVTDYVEYKAHGDFNLGIYTQPCLTPQTGELDPLCIASKSGIEGFDKLAPKKRYIFALFDIDMKAIRFWDCSKTQASKMIGDIEEYAENIGEIAFNFKRTGTKTETVYSLNPILKLDAKGKEGFEAGEGVVVEMSHFESVLIPRTVEQQIEALKNAGFPVEDFFTMEEGSEGVDFTKDEDPVDQF
ncbi:hypothetical protein PDQ75_25110 [Bacillus cereus group sp. Bc015]|uniref:hypothetical protein n=1 Tax=Bacillus cereus group sp. Bc015 TaxID=3018123 RepID=UPI0022E285C0|nr:hypothetical protein [Bacillus cereus group sp. Bc015]MDA2738437.1 hypothetical protein [Bacillus cereus group sp. Bc015]